TVIALGAAMLGFDASAARSQNQRVAAPKTQEQRIAAPADLEWPRDNLTVFAGRVAEYARNNRLLTITSETDWQTRETRTFQYADERALLKRLRLAGKAFVADDWSQIESARGRLREGIRAKVWVCGQASKQTIVRIDWEPLRKQS